LFSETKVNRLFVRAAMIVTVVASCILPIRAQQQTPNQSPGTVTVPASTMERLQQHLAELEGEVQQLKAQVKDMQSTVSSTKGTVPDATAGPSHTTVDNVSASA